MSLFHKKLTIPTADQALPGRSTPLAVPATHYVNGNPMKPPFPDGHESVAVALGCFWGAERAFWNRVGVYSTAVGYIAGSTPHPTYAEVCSGMTGHTEGVLVVFDPTSVTFPEILGLFWESHDPTQGMQQGNDVGTQYRSGIYTTTSAQHEQALQSKATYQERLKEAGHGAITTEILSAPEFYYAEEEHQQYLAKNPGGYCGLGGTGVSCPIGLNP